MTLRDLYVRGKYRDVILPMTVLRRLDGVAEKTKSAVMDMKANLDAPGITNHGAALPLSPEIQVMQWALDVNLAARGNHAVERLKGTALRQVGFGSQFVDRNRFDSVACVQEVMNTADFVAHKC